MLTSTSASTRPPEQRSRTSWSATAAPTSPRSTALRAARDAALRGWALAPAGDRARRSAPRSSRSGSPTVSRRGSRTRIQPSATAASCSARLGVEPVRRAHRTFAADRVAVVGLRRQLRIASWPSSCVALLQLVRADDRRHVGFSRPDSRGRRAPRSASSRCRSPPAGRRRTAQPLADERVDEVERDGSGGRTWRRARSRRCCSSWSRSCCWPSRRRDSRCRSRRSPGASKPVSG